MRIVPYSEYRTACLEYMKLSLKELQKIALEKGYQKTKHRPSKNDMAAFLVKQDGINYE